MKMHPLDTHAGTHTHTHTRVSLYTNCSRNRRKDWLKSTSKDFPFSVNEASPFLEAAVQFHASQPSISDPSGPKGFPWEQDGKGAPGTGRNDSTGEPSEGRGSLKQDKLLRCPETKGKHESLVQGKTERI